MCALLHIGEADASFTNQIHYAILIAKIGSTLGGCDLKYISTDKLSDFEFHDAEFELESYENKCLVVKATYLNIHKDADQNPFETDLEIKSARITFEGFELHSYEPSRTWKHDKDGNWFSDEPQIIHIGSEAHSCFDTQLSAGIRIFDLGVKEDMTYYMDAMAEDPFFIIHFTFQHVTIAWDDYNKEAWYVSFNNKH